MNRKVDHFHVFHEDKEILSLSMERKNILELQKLINHFDRITEKTVNYSPMEVNLKPGVYTKYSIVGESSCGVKVIEHRFVKDKPFCLGYLLIDHSHQFPYPLITFYSIDRFFSPEERKTMGMLIPGWKRY